MMEPDLIFKQISGPTLYHSVPAVLVSFWLCNLSQLLPCWLNEQTSLVCDWFICASHLYLVISKLSLWSATQNGTQWTGPEDKPALLLRWKMSSLSNFGQLSFFFLFPKQTWGVMKSSTYPCQLCPSVWLKAVCSQGRRMKTDKLNWNQMKDETLSYEHQSFSDIRRINLTLKDVF